MAAIYQDGHHGLSWNRRFLPENGTRWSKRIILIINSVFWACRMHSWYYRNYSKVWIVSIWPPISKMAAIDNHVISCLKKAADGSNDDFGWYVICFSKKKASLTIHMPFECLNHFKMAANFQDDRHGLSRKSYFCPKMPDVLKQWFYQ